MKILQAWLGPPPCRPRRRLWRSAPTTDRGQNQVKTLGRVENHISGARTSSHLSGREGSSNSRRTRSSPSSRPAPRSGRSRSARRARGSAASRSSRGAGRPDLGALPPDGRRREVPQLKSTQGFRDLQVQLEAPKRWPSRAWIQQRPRTTTPHQALPRLARRGFGGSRQAPVFRGRPESAKAPAVKF